MSELVRGPCERALVQTSRDLSDWTTHPDIEMLEYSDGQGEIVGHAQLQQAWGDIVRAGQTVSELVSEPTSLGGRLVRILKQSLGGGGSVTYGDDTFEPVWWGKLLSPDAGTSGANGITTYTASGIAALFNERKCWLGRTLVKTPNIAANVRVAFDLAPFNHWPSGDRSTGTFTVGGVAVYIHDATQTSTGNTWSAGDILGNLMACNFRAEDPSALAPDGSGQVGLAWSISDPTGCLAYIPGRYDAKGKTLTQVLNDLAGKKRGLTWWATVSGTTIVLNVASGLVNALTIGTTTIPANPDVWDQLDGGNPFLHPFTIRESNDEVADEIVVQGSPRLIGVSLSIYGSGDPFTANAAAQLDVGWSSAAETACNNFLDNFTAPARSTTYEHAWRRFVLRTTGWNGNQHNSGGMPWSFSPVSNSSYGVNGYDGTVVEGVGGGEKAALWYKAYSNLPCAPGFTALNVGPRQPMVVVAEDYQSGTWYDHTGDWKVDVEESPPAVIIDDNAGGAIVRAILRAGRKIVVSIALRDFFPFQVMWRRDPASWPSSTPRTKTIQAPDLGNEYLLNGMTTGVSSDAGGSLLTTTKVTTKDNLVQLRGLLAQARAWYENPYSLVTFTDRGVWDSDPAYRPGTILGNVNDGANTRVIEAMISRRTVRLAYAAGEDGIQVPYWSTTFETDQVYPDMEAVL